LLGGCADQALDRSMDRSMDRPMDRPMDRATVRPVARAASYSVHAGDTLYSIAWRYRLDYRDLARWNGIGSDFRISPGQVLRLAPPQQAIAPERATSKRAAPVPGLTPTPAAASSGAASGVAAQLAWAWPTETRVAPLPVSGGGVLLQGRLDQDVRAACAGRVVYSGTGIRGYGNLIIIKHGEIFLSAYAHNRETLVREGQEVTLGQTIGKMGEGAPNKPALYFEIRRNGKPVDPLRYLPLVK
jgi:lipoprotein NlpD